MSGRKPPGMSWESFVEEQIEEGKRAGLFDGLEGEGKPIEGLDGNHDPDWWVKSKLRNEKVVDLPPTIAIRGHRDAAVAAALAASDESEVRRIVDDINDRIRSVNSHTVTGPPSTVWVVDVESILERWRAAQPAPPGASSEHDPADEPIPTASPETSAVRARRRRRWGRRRS